jgi:hypothetical protein
VDFAHGLDSNSNSCLKNMDQTYQKVRALNRAYHCQTASDIKECEAMMGLGPTAMVLAAGEVGKKYGLRALGSRRTRTFTPCDSRKKRTSIDRLQIFFGETAWADDDLDVEACFPSDDLKKQHLNIATNQYREELLEQIKKQEEYLEAAKAKLSPEGYEAKKTVDAHLQDLHARTFESQQALDQANESFRTSEGRLVTWFHQKFDHSYGQSRMNELLKDGIQFDLMLWQDNLKRQFGGDKDSLEAYNKLRDEFLAAKDQLVSAQQRFDEVANRAPAIRAREKLGEAQKQFGQIEEQSAAAKELATVSESEKHLALSRMTENLDSMKARLSALDKLQEGFPGTLKNSSDLKHYAKTLEMITEGHDLLVGDRNLRVTVSGIAKDVAGHEVTKPSFVLSHRMTAAKGAIAKVRPGNPVMSAIKFAGAVAATSFVTSAASANDSIRENVAMASELGDKMDINTQVLTKVYDAAKWLTNKHCESDGIFKADPDQDCKVDYSINPNNARIFEYSREDLKNLIQSNPESWCPFIQSNWSEMLGARKATCNKNQMRLTLGNGVQILREFNSPDKVIIKNAPGFTKPIAVKLSSRGTEETLICPITGGMDASQNPTAVLAFDQAELSDHESCRDSLAQYQHYRAILIEATSCYKGTGLKPSVTECSSYGSCSGTSPAEQESNSIDQGTS